MTKRYRWKHAKPLARGNAVVQDGILLPGPPTNYIRENEIFTPTPEELAAFPDRIEEVQEKEK